MLRIVHNPETKWECLCAGVDLTMKGPPQHKRKIELSLFTFRADVLFLSTNFVTMLQCKLSMKLEPSIIVLACAIFHIFIIPKNRPVGDFYKLRTVNSVRTCLSKS